MNKEKRYLANKIKYILLALLLVVVIFFGYDYKNFFFPTDNTRTYESIDVNNLPTQENDSEYYVCVNNNKPYFTDKEIQKAKQEEFEIYSDLDSLGRCNTAFVNVSSKTMPTKDREPIGSVKPTGWQTIKYDNVDGKYLYNRCHLIAYCLAGENANKKNLITGTRSFNVNGMLPFEDEILDYMKDNPNNHVLYRVTPIFKDNELLARGVLMEAKSIETNDIEFCIYAFNTQAGIDIDYQTGKSKIKVAYKQNLYY